MAKMCENCYSAEACVEANIDGKIFFICEECALEVTIHAAAKKIPLTVNDE